MKNWIFFFVCFVSINQVIAQDVPEQQRSLISKVAATWCPPCGGWGWDMFENLIDENEEKAILLVAHHSGDLTNAVAEDFSENFSAPYQPYFYYNIEDQDVNSANTVAKLAEIKDKVDANWTVSPVANAGIAMYVEDDNLHVSTKTKFFQEAIGEYYLGVYFIENNIINNQAGQGNNAVHEKVLRGAISTGSFGELLHTGEITMGTEFDHDFVAALNNMDVEHLEVITIIWRKENGKYDVVNTNISTDFALPVAVEEIASPNATMTVFPSVVNSYATIALSVKEPLKRVQLFLCDLNGRRLKSIFDSPVAAGASTYLVEKTEGFAQGLYYIVFENDGQVISKPIVFE